MKKPRQHGEDTKNALVEAAEQLMLEEGYAAVTARRLMTKAGLKSQLLHYHFASIDDLFLAVIRRRFEMNITRAVGLLSNEDPLGMLWGYLGNEENSRLSIEFLALALHRSAVREEVKRFVEQTRMIQTEAITRFFAMRGVEPETEPMVHAMIVTGLASNLHLEAVHGITLGHAQLNDFIQRRLNLQFDGLGQSEARAKPGGVIPPVPSRQKISRRKSGEGSDSQSVAKTKTPKTKAP